MPPFFLSKNGLKNMQHHTLKKIVHDYLQQHELILPNSTVIVGLSGGPDSTFLLHMIHEFASAHAITVIAAHLDHEWRVNSNDDVVFCQKMAQKLGIKLIVGKRTALACALRNNGSRQELGRKARRAFFETTAREQAADRIALAHHADDQQETFFLRMLRGAALTGLTGIKAKQGLYIHPLLAINKADIISYLDAHGIPYLTDPSNTSDTYLRNRLRKYVLPALRASDDRFDHNFMATITRLQETEAFLEKLTQDALNKICKTESENRILDTDAFLAYEPILQHRILLQWLIHHKVPFTPSTRLGQELIRFFQQPGNKNHTIHPTWSVEKRHGMAKIIRT